MPYRDRAREVSDTFRRWNLKFSSSATQSAEEFLSRLEDCRELTPLEGSEILRALPIIFSGVALEWLRVERKNWATYEEFVESFREWFGDATVNKRLRQQATARTQGPWETVTNYLTCIRGLLHRMTRPYSLEDQLDLAFENLRPDIREYLDREKITSFRELARVATAWERNLALSRDYRPPPAPEDSFMPELACQPQKAAAGDSRKQTSLAAVAVRYRDRPRLWQKQNKKYRKKFV